MGHLLLLLPSREQGSEVGQPRMELVPIWASSLADGGFAHPTPTVASPRAHVSRGMVTAHTCRMALPPGRLHASSPGKGRHAATSFRLPGWVPSMDGVLAPHPHQHSPLSVCWFFSSVSALPTSASLPMIRSPVSLFVCFP